MLIGTVKQYHDLNGWGFIECPEDGEDYFFNSHLVKFLIPQPQCVWPGVQLSSSPEIRYNVCQSPLFSSDAFVPYFLQHMPSSKNQ